MKPTPTSGRSKHTASPLLGGLVWVTLAVAFLGVLAMPAIAQPIGPMQRDGLLPEGQPRGGRASGGMSERMLDDIKATPEQRAQLKQIRESARKDLQAQHAAGSAVRQDMARLLQQPNVDAAALEALHQKRLAQHDVASRRMTQAWLDASRVLTPEQRQQVAERMQQRRQNMQRHREQRGPVGRPVS